MRFRLSQHCLPATVALVGTLLSGCASRPVNEPITKVDPTGGYRATVQSAKRTNQDRKTLFALAFSGGGTRAAAFSYGVLEELYRTEIVVDGQHRRLVDEVDLITGVSGGSFTALAYALYGDRLFSEYEQRFLKRNVQGTLTARTFNPFNWPKIVGGSYGRSELAADYYDEILFQGATFADLMNRPAPMVVVTGTDISTGARLAFTQTDFDLLCSDLSKVHLSRAAATSSAVPVVLSPVTLNNYGGTCAFQYPAWVKDVADPDNRKRPAGRALLRYRDMQAFQQGRERPYIHLVDGGVSDNLGMRGILEGTRGARGEPGLPDGAWCRGGTPRRGDRRQFALGAGHGLGQGRECSRLRGPAPAVLQRAHRPLLVRVGRTDEGLVQRWQTRRELAIAQARLKGKTEAEAEASVPEIALYAIDVSFDSIPDLKERAWFMNLPTSFVLSDKEVDRLRDMGGLLLRSSPDFQRLVKDMGGTVK